MGSTSKCSSMMKPYLKVRSKFKFVYAFKDFAEERLDTQRILCFTQNLQQLIIGQEEEAWEGQPLGLQVIIQPLLDLQQYCFCKSVLHTQQSVPAHHFIAAVDSIHILSTSFR